MHGEVKVSQLTPDELAEIYKKYGPPKPKKEKKESPKPPRKWEYKTPEKINKRTAVCACGEPVQVHDKCKKCYMKDYEKVNPRKNRAKKESKPKPAPKPPKVKVKKVPQYCEIVENGIVCGIKVHCRNMCCMHYNRNKRNGDPLILQRGKKCKIAGCNDDTFSKNMCRKHYMDSKGDK